MLDPDRLENTPDPFKCYRIGNLTGADDPEEKFSGFFVTMKVETRDILGAPKQEIDGKTIAAVEPFPYKCFITGPDSLVVEAPLMSASDRGLDDEKIRANIVGVETIAGLDATECHDLGHSMMKALDNARNKYIERNGGLPGKGKPGYHAAKKHYELRFPPGLKVQLEDGDKLVCNKIKTRGGKKKKQLEEHQLFTRSQLVSYEVNDHTKANADWPTKEFPGADGTPQAFKLWLKDSSPKLYWIVADLSEEGDKLGRKDENEESDDDDDYIRSMRGFLLS